MVLHLKIFESSPGRTIGAALSSVCTGFGSWNCPAQQVQRPVNPLVSKLRNKLEETASILEKWQVNDDDDDDDDLVEKSWQTNRLWLWWGEQLLAVLFNFPPWWCQPKPSSLTAGTEGELFKTRLSCNCSRNQEHLSRQETVLLRFGIFWCVWSIPDILSDTVLLSLIGL